MKLGSSFLGLMTIAGIGSVVGVACTEAKHGGEAAADSAKAEKAPAKPALRDNVERYKVDLGDAYQKGPADARVTIVEFSEFQCPFCSRVGPTLKQIEETYKDDVRIVFKHLPLPFHKDAPKAAAYALAAGEQGKFWEMHDKLFENQRKLDEASLKTYVGELGLDEAKVEAYLASGKADAVLKADAEQARKLGASGTPTFFINGEKLVGAQPFAAFKTVIDQEKADADALIKQGVAKKDVYAKLVANGRTSPPPPPKREAPKPETRSKIVLSDKDPSRGAGEPLVTIVEWSDFECPFCSRVGPTVDRILKDYKGKVQLRFRHQPLSFHKNAMPAAKASVAAQNQGKFWEMHDKLFANQKKLAQADLEGYAKELGLKLDKFKADMADPATEARIKADMAEGSKMGARGTPTFFVNGVAVRGAQPFERFKAVIDKEIELAEKLIKRGVAKKDLYDTIMKEEAGKPLAEIDIRPMAPPVPAGPVKIHLGEAPVKGPKKAPVELVIWSDFQCPFCSRLNPTITKIEETYGKKVKVAFKQYPLPFHGDAELAGVASMAAQQQGKFWEMHDKLFANQRKLKRDDLIAYAKELKLNVKRFEKALDDPKLKARLKAEMAEGVKAGVRGTPATFVNGVMIAGAVPFERFKLAIDAELAKK